ncbi:hypothetical protein VNI00_010506 [Paramarasmius palmivorus]|uniref:Polymerase nucleotidyl transferase domain-containing protein n=1 Tax=Paramarasmius palmivorus TaxID=297713 RepID=A0AAW0CJF3_9AGAR
MPPFQATADEIKRTTRAVVAVLKKLNLECCLVGSVACSAYGMSRTPNDIDMVVLTKIWTQEELKRQVVANDPNFYTIASKDPFATYRVLFYRLNEYTSRYLRRSCKVDLLLPGVMNIPNVPTSYIRYIDDRHRLKPLMPFLPLLMLKLQAWMDHGESTKLHMRAKQPVDVRDIMELLNLAVTKYTDVKLAKEESWLPDTFVSAGRKRVRAFTRMYPTSARHWKAVGF